MIKHVSNALKHRHSEKGFSLVELVVVVAILGVLVVVAIPVFGAVQSNARGNTLTTAAHNAASSVASAISQGAARADLTSTSPSAKHNVVKKMNDASVGQIVYTLAPTTASSTALSAPPQKSNSSVTSISAGALRVAANNSTETVFIYATDTAGNWIGVGTGQADHKIGAWR
jgi:prepilin-type N-terminal cleavage/methylation domain-containing protein